MVMGKRKRSASGYLKKTFTFEGKRYYVYGHNNEELTEKEVKKRQELKNGVINRQNPTLYAYYDYFTQIRENKVKGATMRSQISQFNNIASVIVSPGIKFGDMRINDISRKDIEFVRLELLKQGKTPENLNICFAHLNHVFNAAVNDDTIIKNPCKALERLTRSSKPINETRHRALTESETKLFFQAASERESFYINAFKLMLFTGVRIGELAALNKTDFDTKSGYLHINKTITRDSSGGYCIGKTTKTEKGKRDIPLTLDIVRVSEKQEQMNNMFFGLSFSNMPLFRSTENGLLKEYTINREIKRICKAANIEEFTCHAFRNTFATRFIEQRPQDYKILSEILGHADIKITLNLYTHVMSENKINAMRELNFKIS